MSGGRLSSLFHGDFNIEQGCDTNNYGWGDITVNRNAYIGVGVTTISINPTTGSLVVFGGAGILGDSNLQGIITINSTSNLQTTFIDTTLGPFSVSGGNSAIISVGGFISITSTLGNVNLNSISGTSIIQGGLNSNNAVQLLASNIAGGVNIVSGQAGQVQLTSGSGGIQGIVSSGNLNLTSNNGSASFTVNSSSANQNLTLSLNGLTNSEILIQSAGINNAIILDTTSISGSILIANNNGSGTGSINLNTGSSGFSVTTNTGGPIQLSASAASSYFIVNTTNANQNLTIGVNGATNSSLILQSSGINSTQAILIQNTNTAGSILINQPLVSAGGVTINTGSSGFNVLTRLGGGINYFSNSAKSSFINQTTSNNQDLTIAIQGSTGSKLILSSQGIGSQSILISATGVSSGIYAISTGPVSINTSDTITGINIGTLTQAPVNLGSSNNITTIYGNLDVRGTTTTYESTVVQIADNIIQLNNAPSGIADAGVAIKRYQPANNLSLGTVVSDTPDETGIAQTGNSGTITLSLSDTANSTDFYSGYWIKIISGTGAGQVRRLKSFNFLTKIANIFTTADQTGVLNNPKPAEGLDWLTIPDGTSNYALYPCAWIASIWNEFDKTYSIACSNLVNTSSTIPIANYVNLHVNNIIGNNLNVNTINNTTADIQTIIVLTDNLTTPVSINALPYNYGNYIIMIQPTTATANRPYATFIVIRRNDTTSCGNANILMSSRGLTGEQLDIQWPAGQNAQLYYKPAPGINGTTSYTLKIISI